jgi:predicted nucleotidyltransferase
MRPSEAIKGKEEQIRALAAKYNTTNPRLFGSVLHGTDTETSDVDILVDPLPGTTLIHLGGLLVELEKTLGVEVDVKTPGDLHRSFKDEVLLEAVPI